MQQSRRSNGELGRFDSQEARDHGAGHVHGLLGLNQLSARGGEFGLSPRGVRARTQFRTYQRIGGPHDDFRPVHTGLGGARGFLRGNQRQTGVRRGYRYFEPGPLERGFRLGLGSRGGGHGGPPQAEIERLPGDQRSDGAAPGGAQIVRADHRAGHGRERALRQQQPEDVVASGAVDLRQGVHARQVGGSREAYAGRGGVDLFLRDLNGRVIVERVLNRLHDGEWGRRGLLGQQSAGGQGHQFEFTVLPHVGYSPSMSSRNNSRTLPVAARSAFRPGRVAR